MVPHICRIGSFMNHSRPSTRAIATATKSLLSNTLPLFSAIEEGFLR